jgi:hypothetical protein
VRPFVSMLRVGLKLAESTDSAKYGFKQGDAEHLRRWLNNRHATATFAKLTKGKKVTVKLMAAHIKWVLVARDCAEAFDRLNATFVELERQKPQVARKVRRRLWRAFANDIISQEELDARLADLKEAHSKPDSNLNPLFVIRSDRGGSRKRTIFCRMLSKSTHSNYGRWHDAEVAALCNIAFDCDCVTVEAVKLARKGLIPRSRR